MAYTTENNYTGNGSTRLYSFTFPYLEDTDIKVSLNQVDTTNFTLANATQIQFSADASGETSTQAADGSPKSAVAIKVYRDTNIDNLQSEFFSGSAVRAQDLNNDFNQTLYVAQETEKAVEGKWNDSTQTIDSTEAFVDSNDYIMTAAAIDDRIIAKQAARALADGKIIVGNGSGVGAQVTPSGDVTMANTGAFTIANTSVENGMLANDAVTGAKIADDAIDSEHYVDGSIDTAHIADSQITSAKIADGTIVAGDLASDSVTTAKIANLNVTTGKLAADAVTGAKIADDAIDSEHYTDGSIDTAHIADANVTLAKVENVSSAQIIVGNGSNRPTAVAVSGDVTISNAGAVTIANDAVEQAMIADDAVGADQLAANAVVNDSVASGAAIAHSKLAAVPDGQIIVGNGSTVPTAVAVSGDVTIANTGAVTIANDAVEIGMIGCEQTTISDSDSHIPTSGAVVDYVAAQIAPIGGLEVIADDESFPNTIPAAGVVISITDAAGLQINSSGVSTNGDTLDNSTVTINGFPSSLRGGVGSNADPYVLGSGAGLMVQSTGSSQTYNYHKALLKESDFVQLSDDINDFNSKYRIASSAPGSDNDEGDLYFNTSTNKMYVYDGSAWGEVTSTGDYKYLTIKDHDQAVGGSGPTFNGSNEEFDLFDGSSDASITTAAQLLVVLNGVIQKPNTGTFSGSEEGFYLNDTHGIKFCDPPASGSTLFVTQLGTATTVNVPADGSVTAAKIGSGAVTTAKIGADAVDGTKLADNACDSEHYTDGSIDHVHLAGDCVDGDNLADNACDSEHYTDGSIDHVHLAGDCIDGDNLADNAVDSEHYTDGSIDTAHIADNQITLAKMAGGTDGQIITYDASGDPVAVGPGTDGQVLTSTGAGSPPAFETIATSPPGNRNLIVNGAMRIAQRGAGPTAGNGHLTVDRWACVRNAVDEDPTQTQITLTSSDTGPWAKGFKKAFQVTNGNQTSGAGSDDKVEIYQNIEGGDINSSGWIYTDPNSDITLSFWVKSSVAQNFYILIRTNSGTLQSYTTDTGSLSANTWTYVQRTIPGFANNQIDDNVDAGLCIQWFPFLGTDKTGTLTTNQWAAYSGTEQTPDSTATWYTTNDATFALTGVQLEVASAATDYEHRNTNDDMTRCQRYYWRITGAANDMPGWSHHMWHASASHAHVSFPTPMRKQPSFTQNCTAKIVSSDSSDTWTSGMYFDNPVTSHDNGSTFHSATYRKDIAGSTIDKPGTTQITVAGNFEFAAEI